MENSLARTEASQTRLNHRFTKFAHTFSDLTIDDLQLANVKRRLDQDLKLEELLAVTACHNLAAILDSLIHLASISCWYRSDARQAKMNLDCFIVNFKSSRL